MTAEQFTQRLWKLSVMVGGRDFKQFHRTYDALLIEAKQDVEDLDLHTRLERNERLIAVLKRELKHAKEHVTAMEG